MRLKVLGWLVCRECREGAQQLIENASGQLKSAKDALASAQAAETSAEQALSAAGSAVPLPPLCRDVASVPSMIRSIAQSLRLPLPVCPSPLLYCPPTQRRLSSCCTRGVRLYTCMHVCMCACECTHERDARASECISGEVKGAREEGRKEWYSASSSGGAHGKVFEAAPPPRCPPTLPPRASSKGDSEGMYVPAGNAARENMLSLQPQAVGAPPAPPANGAAPAPVGAEGAQAMGQADIKPPVSSVSSTGGPSDVQSSSKGEQVGQEIAHKRRRTADLVSRLDSISRDI